MILVLNCGSQSIKYKLFNSDLSLVREKILEVRNQREYQRILIKELGQLRAYQDKINLVGHRVVHGGEKFRKALLVDSKTIREIGKFNHLAPLHNPFNLLGIKTALMVFPKAKQAAVFDTAFYSDLPEKADLYSLPLAIKDKYNFHRFGFHGISHEYAAVTAAKMLKRPLNKLKLITCHLGGGSSITAVKEGKAVDTSMGFTPLAGVLMMTRSGDIDPGIVIKLCQVFSPREADRILNKESGLKGICGFSDMKDVLSEIKKGDKKCQLALDVFVYQIQKYIGAYSAILSGCDALVFTGGIGAGSQKIRNLIAKAFQPIKVLSVQANEELAIARQIKKNMNSRKGFTLIELLVVIAIIGILSSIILVNVNGQKLKAHDANIKSLMHELRNGAELVYNNSGSYDLVCTDDDKLNGSGELSAIKQGIENENPAGQVTCIKDLGQNKFAASFPLLDRKGKHWCVESVGISVELANPVTTADCQ